MVISPSQWWNIVAIAVTIIALIVGAASHDIGSIVVAIQVSIVFGMTVGYAFGRAQGSFERRRKDRL
jgi:hypothetical protein